MGLMEFREVVRRRRMVRRFDAAREVPLGALTHILYAAQRAPSAGFSQGWDFVVLADHEDRARFWEATADPDRPVDAWLAGVGAAPVLVLCLSDPDSYLDRYAEPDKGWTDRDPSRWPVPYWDVDTGMAALLILLGATDRGLASCFFGVPPDRWDALRAAFDVPERLRPVGVVSLGHPAPDVRSPSLRRGRRSAADVVSYGSFGAASG
jgi:nitroreductase